MPFHPHHFQLVENGFLLTIDTPTCLWDRKSAVDYQFAIRKHFINHLEVDGHSAKDMAICCDGSDGQIWFEYPTNKGFTREVINQQVSDALNFWNSLKVLPFLSPSLVKIGHSVLPLEDLQPVSLTSGGND